MSDREINFENAPNILLYVANVMDYMRVAFVTYSFIIAKESPYLFLILYFTAFVLDMFDGMAARYFNQKSKLGATLDMVTDRISTSGLLMVLSNFYPNHSHYFILLMMLDIGSHWLQTHSGFMDPNIKNDNHKNLEEKFWVLNFYYKNRYGLGITCLGAELYLLILYFLHFEESLMKDQWMFYSYYVCAAIYALKQFISVIQVISASTRIARFDQKEFLEENSLKNN